MKYLILKIGLLAFVVFSAMVLLGDKLNVFYNLFPDPETAKSYIMTGSTIAIFASLAVIVVRTILGILTVLFIAVLIFIILRTDLFDALLKSLQ